MGHPHGAVHADAITSQSRDASRSMGYNKIWSVVSTWPLQAPGAWLTAAPAPLLTGKSRPCDDILSDIDRGSFAKTQVKMHETKDRYDRISEAISPDADPISTFVRLLGALKAGGIASLPKEALRQLEHEVPGRSILSGEAGGLGQRRRRKIGRAYINPTTPEPRMGNIRPPKKISSREIPCDRRDPFVFDAKWLRKRARRARAHQQIAHDDAADLEDAVWHLWIDVDENLADNSEDDQADAASADGRSHGGQSSVGQSPAKLGSMKFIVDTGCGSNLIGLHYLRSAGAMGKLQKLKTAITLNTAGGSVKSPWFSARRMRPITRR